MKNVKQIAPSILAADPLNLEAEIQSIKAGGADFIHVDVMDGHFVPNLSLGLPFVRALKKINMLPLDVHIMVSNPDAVALDYVEAGADLLSFHIEAAIHPVRIAQSIRENSCSPGVAINPGTPIAVLEPVLPFLDFVNVMAVNPGFGGQKFMPQAARRVLELRELCDSLGLSELKIEVDGGVTDKTANLLQQADILVAGTYVFGAVSRGEKIKSLK